MEYLEGCGDDDDLKEKPQKHIREVLIGGVEDYCLIGNIQGGTILIGSY